MAHTIVKMRAAALEAAAHATATDEEMRVFLRGVLLRHNADDPTRVEIIGCDGYLLFITDEGTWEDLTPRLPDEGIIIPRRAIQKLRPNGGPRNVQIVVIYDHHKAKVDIESLNGTTIRQVNCIRDEYTNPDRILASHEERPLRREIVLRTHLLAKVVGMFSAWRLDDDPPHIPLHFTDTAAGDAFWVKAGNSDLEARCIVMGVKEG